MLNLKDRYEQIVSVYAPRTCFQKNAVPVEKAKLGDLKEIARKSAHYETKTDSAYIMFGDFKDRVTLNAPLELICIDLDKVDISAIFNDVVEQLKKDGICSVARTNLSENGMHMIFQTSGFSELNFYDC